MFEAVVALCLGLADEPCRNQLLPGYEASTEEECVQALAGAPPNLDRYSEYHVPRLPRCVAMGEVLPVTEVASGIFVHAGLIEEPDMSNSGDVSNLGFIIGEDAVAVIDTGTARWMGEALWRAIRTRTDKPVSHVILSHPHPDHVFGAGPFAEAGAVVVAHENLPRALADRRANYLESLETLVGREAFIGTEIVQVSLAVGETTEIELGNRAIQLDPWATAHTTADLTVLDRQTRTLFAGDLVFHRHTPALDGHLTGWQAVLQHLRELGAERIVPGHGAHSLDVTDAIDPVARYLDALETDTRKAIEDGERLGDAVKHIGASEAEKWELFDAYNPRNATVAYTELEWE